jgi:hypothetical protein
MRIVVWRARDVKMMDFEGTSDVYIKTQIQIDDFKSKFKETDTHYRCMDGNASFNWRIK